MTYANTLKAAVACAIIGISASAAPAQASELMPKFDRKLAKILADKAAEALGDLRLGGEQDVAMLPTRTRTFFGRTVTDFEPSVPDFGRSGTDAIETGSIRTYQPHPVAPAIDETDQPVRWNFPRTDIRVVYAG